MKIEWGEWIEPPTAPELGDYIQSKKLIFATLEIVFHEGLVGSVDETGFTLMQHMPAYHNNDRRLQGRCLRWRKRIIPEHEPKVTEKEVENV